MKLTQNKLSVILATVVAGVSIMANCMTAKAAEPVKTGLNDCYVLAGTVYRQDVVDGYDVNDNERMLRYFFIIDKNGEEWCYAYEINEQNVPFVGQKVTMIMDNNGTAEDITDDIIEDLLFCNDCGEEND